jgi:hypothetical protein
MWTVPKANFGRDVVPHVHAQGTAFVHHPKAFKPGDETNSSSIACDGGDGPPKTMEGACWLMVVAGAVATAFALPLYTPYKRLELEMARDAADDEADDAAGNKTNATSTTYDA